jgi:thiol-disulfide isomerase/thioredoxin
MVTGRKDKEPLGLDRILRWGVLGAGILALSLLFSPGGAPLQPGTPAPGLALRGLDGGPVDVSAHAGKPTVLNFFATWCQPCWAEVPELNALHEEVGDTVNVVGVLVFSGGPEEVAGALRKMAPRYPVFLTDDASAARYNVSSVPATILVDGQGVVAWSAGGAVTREEVVEALKRLPATTPGS